MTVVLAAACGSSGPKSDWERANEAKLAAPTVQEKQQAAAALPNLPSQQRGELIEFTLSPPSEFRFFIDAASLSVDSDGEVRYVLVARSPAGVENVTYEGMRCNSNEYRVYALGRDGAWVGRPTDWRPIRLGPAQRWHGELAREYFCPQREAITSAREGVLALRNGGHPQRRGFGSPALGR